ncbi:MAG: sugar transferase [Anaerolineaceae bacterium]|nr:sugar transferase [Anaerolineaceae bacterium]
MIDWVLNIDPEKALLKGKAYSYTKRFLDVFFVLLSAPFVLPVLGIIAFLIKAGDWQAHVWFAQDRTGRGGTRFQMYKFRTMAPNAEKMKKELMHLNELEWPDFKITNDPRITRVGRILRKTSLDELPQLLNVLRGEMSLVGPRPTSFRSETYKLWQTERLDILPGITGVWQIVGRGESEFDDRLPMDIAYIQHRCLWLDFQILLRTFLAVLQRKGAK